MIHTPRDLCSVPHPEEFSDSQGGSEEVLGCLSLPCIRSRKNKPHEETIASDIHPSFPPLKSGPELFDIPNTLGEEGMGRDALGTFAIIAPLVSRV